MTDTCAGCRYFRRHYVKSGRGYAPIAQGHCVHPRLKDRPPAQGPDRGRPRLPPVFHGKRGEAAIKAPADGSLSAGVSGSVRR